MLLQIRDYLRREKRASDEQISRVFRIELDALTPMLQYWVKKDIFQLSQDTASCQSACFKCKTSAPLYYEYKNPS